MKKNPIGNRGSYSFLTLYLPNFDDASTAVIAFLPNLLHIPVFFLKDDLYHFYMNITLLKTTNITENKNEILDETPSIVINVDPVLAINKNITNVMKNLITQSLIGKFWLVLTSPVE